MSSPHVIISAVHELTEEPEEFWNTESVQEAIEDLNKDEYNNTVDWYMTRAMFRSTVALQRFPIAITYHSNRGTDVVEITLDGEESMKGIGVTNMEEILEEINNSFEHDFTLEAYYWYDGVDRPGGC